MERMTARSKWPWVLLTGVLLVMPVLVVIEMRSGGDIVQSPAAPLAASVRQRDCDYHPQYHARLECFWVETSRANFTFAAAVFRATTADSAADPLVYIAGGPGEAGNTAAPMLEVWDEWFARVPINRDLVLVDLRGLAPGVPSWDCTAYVDVSKQLLQHNLSFAEEAARTQPVLQECLQHWLENIRLQQGPVEELAEFSSTTNARDLADVLGRLGYNEWNYLAVSYGTRVALVAALNQPQVRRIILDSPYPLERGQLSDTAVLWSAAFAQYWRNCAISGCAVDEARFWKIMQRLRENPLWVEVEDWQSGKHVRWLLNDGRLAAALYSAMYNSGLRAEIAPALRDLSAQRVVAEDSPLQHLLEIFYNQVFDSSFNSAVFWATECNDNRLQSEADFTTALADLGPWQEYFANDWRYDICRAAAFRPDSLPAMQSLNIPALIVVGALDPITTLQHAEDLMQWLPGGRLLTLAGKGHAEFFADACGQVLIPWFLQIPEAQMDLDWNSKVLGCIDG